VPYLDRVVSSASHALLLLIFAIAVVVLLPESERYAFVTDHPGVASVWNCTVLSVAHLWACLEVIVEQLWAAWTMEKMTTLVVGGALVGVMHTVATTLLKRLVTKSE
jgi:hypothetical protein